MARIAGVDLPREKRIEIGLTYIYGIGRTSSSRILAAANVNPDTRVRDLTDDEVKRISAVIDETQLVEGKFVKILEICKQFSENLVNDSGNVPRRGPVPKGAGNPCRENGKPLLP